RAGQTMDLVDEENVAFVETRQDGGEVAGPLERGARCDLQTRLELVGDDAGERGLAQTRRTREQQVVARLPASPRRFEDDTEVLLELGLADELVEPLRPQADVVAELTAGGCIRPFVDQLVVGGTWVQELVAHQTLANRCSACLSMAPG